MKGLAVASSLADEPVLLRELNHRVNNEFASAISVVSLAAARSSNSDVKIALTAVTDLLHHYASVHRALQMPEHDTELDAEAYLRQLCFSISRSHLEHRKITLVHAVEPLRLRADVSWRLGMIVYELIINAVRHAFEGGGGEIRISIWRNGAFVKCSVQDKGLGAANIRRGRGLAIVHALSTALGGCFRQAFEPRGSKSLLTFPCASASNTHAKLFGPNGANLVADAASRQRPARCEEFTTCR
jgi:two-component sensor histidine kinase